MKSNLSLLFLFVISSTSTFFASSIEMKKSGSIVDNKKTGDEEYHYFDDNSRENFKNPSRKSKEKYFENKFKPFYDNYVQEKQESKRNAMLQIYMAQQSLENEKSIEYYQFLYLPSCTYHWRRIDEKAKEYYKNKTHQQESDLFELDEETQNNTQSNTGLSKESLYKTYNIRRLNIKKPSSLQNYYNSLPQQPSGNLLINNSNTACSQTLNVVRRRSCIDFFTELFTFS